MIANDGKIRKASHVLVSKELGGGERVGIDIARYMKLSASWETRIVAPRGGSTALAVKAQDLDLAGYNEERLYSKKKFQSALESLAIRRKMLFGKGVAHFHAPFLYGALTRAPALYGGVKTLVHVHLDYTDGIWGLAKPPDSIIVCADYLKRRVLESIEEKYRDAVKVHTVLNYVNTSTFTPAESGYSERGFGPESPFIVSIIANLSPHKGQITAVNAISQLLKKGLSFKLRIVGSAQNGENAYEASLRELVQRLQIFKNVEFLGQRNDVPTLLRESDALLLPSKNEGLPLSILEAQSSGVVVIAAPTAGIPEIISEGQTGFLIDADDATGYACALEKLYRDRTFSKILSVNALINIRRTHTESQYMNQIQKIYHALIP